MMINKLLNKLIVVYRKLCWDILKCFRKYVEIETKQGIFYLPVYLDDPISKSLFVNRDYELDFTNKVVGLLDRIGILSENINTIVDIGANNGVVSIGLLSSGTFDKAIAIEPDPFNFKLLKKNIIRNNLESRIISVNKAVSDVSGTTEFELSDTNLGDHRVHIRKINSDHNELFNESQRNIINIPADNLPNIIRSLDQKFTKNISLIWIDIQGYEGYVFRGARNLLKKGLPVVSEIWPYGIKRSGMEYEDFYEICGKIWKSYWVERKDKFVKNPISVLPSLFDELGSKYGHQNVIFTTN